MNAQPLPNLTPFSLTLFPEFPPEHRYGHRRGSPDAREASRLRAKALKFVAAQGMVPAYVDGYGYQVYRHDRNDPNGAKRERTYARKVLKDPGFGSVPAMRPYAGTEWAGGQHQLNANCRDKAADYARWLAARDGVALPKDGPVSVDWAHVKLAAYVHTICRASSVTFGKGGEAVTVQIPHVHYDPTLPPVIQTDA